MKASRYNFFAKRLDGRVTAFNAVSGALGTLSEAALRLYEKTLENGTDNLSEQEAVVLSEMEKANFVVPREMDELKALQVEMNRRRYDSSVLGLTIMPTSACNLQCRYCYEKAADKKMSPETVRQLHQFVRENLYQAKRLEVTWYGGEPLLEKETIYELSAEFKNICNEQNCSYSAGIITNGLLLDRETARRLAEVCAVGYCQVTLDGPRDVHDARRPLKNGGGSFETILNNLREASRYLKINVRINIDRDNEENYLELLDDLDALKDGVKLHIGMVEPIGRAKVCIDTASKCLDDEKTAEKQVQFYREASKRGFRPQFYLVPANVFGLCAAEIDRAFVVEPDGSLQKCWVTVGDEKERVGHIESGIPMSPRLLKWVSFDPVIMHAECRDCKVLPLCYGNCAYRALDKIDGHHCGMWRYKLESVLESIEEFQASLEREVKCEGSDHPDIHWIYEGANSRGRCFIVCIRCTGLACSLGSCKPVCKNV